MGKKLFLILGVVFLFLAASIYSFAKIAPDTSDWKIYKNSAYGFSLKYPSTWKAEEYPTNDGVDFWAPMDERGGFRVFITKIPKKQSLQKYLKDLDKERAKPSMGMSSDFRVYNSKKTKVNKLGAIQRKETLGASGLTTLVTYVKKGGFMYEFVLHPSSDSGLYTDDDASTYHTILSTIQFVK